VKGATYWYTFVVANKTNRVVSTPVQVIALPRTGHGPQEIVWGDQDWGIYGYVDENLFITTAKLFSLFEPGGSFFTTSGTVANYWNKFVRNGKTLFVPRKAVSFNTNWNDLYLKGLVFGVNGPGPQTGGNPETNQLRTVIIDGDEYIVRLPTGFDDRDNPTRVIPGELTPSNGGPFRKYSELADLFWSTIPAFPPDRNRAMNGLLMWYYPLIGSSGGSIIPQEINPNNNSIMAPLGFTANTDVQPFFRSTQYANASRYAACGWWPILELIETLEVVV